MPNNDIFGKAEFKILHPVTADQMRIQWGDDYVTQATNVQIQYQQQVTRKYTLGSPQNQAMVIPGRPIGTISIGRLFAAEDQDIFSLPGWDVCDNPATLYLQFLPTESTTKECITSNLVYIVTGAYVTGYSLQGNADDLQVIDSISIEFLQLAVNL